MPVTRPSSVGFLSVDTHGDPVAEPAKSSGPLRRGDNRDARASARATRASPYARPKQTTPTPSAALGAQLAGVTLKSVTRSASRAAASTGDASRSSSDSIKWPTKEEVERATQYVMKKVRSERQRMASEQKKQEALSARLAQEMRASERKRLDDERSAARAQSELLKATEAAAKEAELVALGKGTLETKKQLEAERQARREVARVLAANKRKGAGQNNKLKLASPRRSSRRSVAV